MKRHCLRTFLVVALLLGLNGLVGRVRAATPFIRGDANRDSALSVSDAVTILRHLFEGDRSILVCLDPADVDDDGGVTVTDAIVFLQHLFAGGRPPAAPSRCGPDPTEDALACESNGACQTKARTRRWPSEPPFHPAAASWRPFMHCLCTASATPIRAVRVLQHLFLGGPPPEPPVGYGRDCTEDGLACEPIRSWRRSGGKAGRFTDKESHA